jgi:zona occludens toxin
MAITAYVGLPGHGKSYGVVENVLIPALKQKRIIFTNIPMKTDAVLEQFETSVIQFEVDDIKSNPNWWSEVFTAGALFVLDEVPKLWPAGLKANAIHENDRAFLAEHRHMVGDEGTSTEIVLIVQNLTMIAAFPRGLVESTYWVVKHIKMGSNKRYRVDIYSGVMAGQTPQLARREREIQGKFTNKVYDLYHSHTKSKNGVAGNESKIDNRTNMFKGASIKIGIFVMCLCVVGVYFGAQVVAEMYQPEKLPDSVEVTSTISNSRQTVQVEKPKKKGLLNQVDEITFSYSLKQRVKGVISRTNFFNIVMGQTQSLVTDSNLRLLGYKIHQISECLFHVTNDNFDQFIMCPKVEDEGGFFNNLTSSDSV